MQQQQQVLKNYVLYVLDPKTDEKSNKSLRTIYEMRELFHVQLISEIPYDQRPTYLSYPPVLIDNKRKRAFNGDFCLQELEKIIQTLTSPQIPNGNLNSLYLNSNPSMIPKEQLGGYSVRILDNDEKITAKQLEEYMKMRDNPTTKNIQPPINNLPPVPKEKLKIPEQKMPDFYPSTPPVETNKNQPLHFPTPYEGSDREIISTKIPPLQPTSSHQLQKSSTISIIREDTINNGSGINASTNITSIIPNRKSKYQQK